MKTTLTFDVTYSLCGTLVDDDADRIVSHIYEERVNGGPYHGIVVRKYRVNNREK